MLHRKIWKCGTASLITALSLCGQLNSSTPAFDAASVKRAEPPPGAGVSGKTVRSKTGAETSRGGRDTSDPGRIHYPRVTLKAILMRAYGVREGQILGPAWLDTEWFSIEATMPPDTTEEQFRVMLRNLLKDRFKVTTHLESRNLSAFSLIVSGSGPRMNGATPVTIKGRDGAPLSETKRIVHTTFATPPLINFRWTAVQATMDDLVKDLADQLHAPVTNATGLRGKYDFALDFSRTVVSAETTRQEGEPDAREPSDIFSAIQSIGLKLEERKNPVEVILVDHVEKVPTEN